MPEVVAQQVKSDVGLASAIRSSTLRLSRQLRRQRVDGADLTANQLGVLGALGKHDAMTIGELAAHEQVKPPSMTRIVSNMEEGRPRRPPPARHRQAPDRGRADRDRPRPAARQPAAARRVAAEQAEETDP
ncbi:MarR family transcriptional regulator [Kribbella qitaiheensis]|uniref:MarR family transcriptional regulator n=1 Tax=Kribbella qitaiheensis TaxID=1544730 RepID=UPI001FE9A222|nr:MarR family transcriptional regulator [Kribbella qitaiheensis]